jgi:hypothetical protein
MAPKVKQQNEYHIFMDQKGKPHSDKEILGKWSPETLIRK